jgi:hypothetical protein
VSAVADAICTVCGIPTDAGFFDASRIVAAPALGEEVVLAEYQLHRSYCGALLYFAQFTDRFAADPAEVETPGIEWQIRCNNQPRDPYLAFDRIINPWGLSGFPIHLRLEEGCRVQLLARNVGGTAITRIGGRLLGRYWYNLAYGSLAGSR